MKRNDWLFAATVMAVLSLTAPGAFAQSANTPAGVNSGKSDPSMPTYLPVRQRGDSGTSGSATGAGPGASGDAGSVAGGGAGSTAAGSSDAGAGAGGGAGSSAAGGGASGAGGGGAGGGGGGGGGGN